MLLLHKKPQDAKKRLGLFLLCFGFLTPLVFGLILRHMLKF